MEKGLQYETTWLDLPSREHKKAEYLAINPVGKVPALIDDGVIVHDSTVINEYLEDKYPQHPLLPKDPAKRARVRSLEDYADAYFAPSNGKIVFQMRKPEGERDQVRIAEGEREVLEHFAYLERELQGREYLADEISLADLSFVPQLFNYERAGYSVPDRFPNVKAWWERLKARPSFKASWPS